MLPCRGESASVPGVPVWPWRSGAVGPFRPNGRRVPPSLLCVSLAQKARCVLGPAFARPPGGPGRSLCQTGRGGPRGAAGRRPPTASRSLPGLSFRFSRFPEFLLTFKRRLRLAARESCVLEPSWPEVAVGGQAPGTGKKREDKKKRISAGVSGPEARRDAWNGGVRRPTVRGEPGDLERFRGCEEPRWRKQRPLSAGETLSRFPAPQENYPSPPAASLHTSVVPGQHQAIAFGSCSPLPWACAAVGNLSQLKSLLTCFHGKPGWRKKCATCKRNIPWLDCVQAQNSSSETERIPNHSSSSKLKSSSAPRVTSLSKEAMLFTGSLLMLLGKHQKAVQVLGPLLPTWETWIKLLASGPALAVVAIWEMNQQMGDLSLSLSVSLSL
ncbi:uncharacterized protein [Oryctolagus cuniculus]|uniref:uncharacterized protein n=1 Tax=Oryctolagus cuniculus TaxID=9986 RepID=UPI003879A159